PVSDRVDRHYESLETLFTALEAVEEPFSTNVKYNKIRDARVVPPATRRFRIFTGGTSDKTYVLAGTRGWGVVVPPLLPYEALREQLDLYRATCAEHGNEPDIVWIHACHIDEDRDTALRDAESWIAGGADHWQAIKAQELFAHQVMPHFRSAARPAAEATPA